MLHGAMLKKSLQPLRKVELNSTFRNAFCNCFRNVLAVARNITLGSDSWNLSRNGVARQVARKIAQGNSAFIYIYIFQHSAKSLFDLWLFLLRWPHTSQAFLETSPLSRPLTYFDFDLLCRFSRDLWTAGFICCLKRVYLGITKYCAGF